MRCPQEFAIWVSCGSFVSIEEDTVDCELRMRPQWLLEWLCCKNYLRTKAPHRFPARYAATPKI